MTSLSDSCCGGVRGRWRRGVDAVLGGLYELIAPHLTKKQRRLFAGAAARVRAWWRRADGTDLWWPRSHPARRPCYTIHLLDRGELGGDGGVLGEIQVAGRL